jgi:hypothetical protein
MCEEVWKKIDNFPSYECSTMGRFRRKDKLLKFGVHQKGYLYIRLYKNGKQYTFRAHRLVYAVFIGPIPEGFEINHTNGDKTNNTVSNLDLTNHSENMKHAVRTGLLKFKTGKDHLLSIPIIGEHIETGDIITFSGQQEASRYGFNQGNIQSVLKGKRHSHKGYVWRYKPRHSMLIIDRAGIRPYEG